MYHFRREIHCFQSFFRIFQRLSVFYANAHKIVKTAGNWFEIFYRTLILFRYFIHLLCGYVQVYLAYSIWVAFRRLTTWNDTNLSYLFEFFKRLIQFAMLVVTVADKIITIDFLLPFHNGICSTKVSAKVSKKNMPRCLTFKFKDFTFRFCWLFCGQGIQKACIADV